MWSHRFFHFLLAISLAPWLLEAEELPLKKLKLPAGFHAEIYARVKDARSMALSPTGVLFVGSRTGAIHAVMGNAPSNREVIKIVDDLRMPNGVAFKDGALYVAEISRVLKFENILANLKNPPKPIVINDSFPTEESHGW